MTWPIAKATVDLLLNSVSDDKLLSIYGGEPLLQFPLLKQTVMYAREMEKENNKHLTITCCTNSLLLKDEHLSFFKEFNVLIHVSLFGHEEDNDRYRAKGFKKVIENLAKSSEVLGPTRTAACVCVTPQTVHYLREDIETIRQKTGTRVLTIEPIIEFESWKLEEVAVFLEQMRLICQDLKSSVTINSPFFLNSLCWHLVGTRRNKFTMNPGYDQCPFSGTIDVSPSGDIAFSSFALYAKKEKRGVVGNVQEQDGAWWQSCAFKRESTTCLDCYSKHYSLGVPSDKSNYLMKYMDAIIDETARFLQAAAKSDQRYGQYIKEAQAYAS